MLPVIPIMHIDDLSLQKFAASEKIKGVLSFVSDQGNGKLIKTASTDNSNIINLFVKMLSCLDLKVSDDNTKNVLESLSNNSDLNKVAIKKSSGERKDEIKIASKSIKDSHYQIDVSKDVV